MFSARLLRIKKFNFLTAQFSNLHIHRTSSVPIPRLENVAIIYNHWLYRQNEHVNLPKSVNLNINFELPNSLKNNLAIVEPTQSHVIEAPPLDDSVKKEAVKMIVIRRKKMKKHKLKKLRKRMKFEWAKKRQRREWKKEKIFQAKLIQQCNEAEHFSAEQYIEEKINKYKEAVAATSEIANVQTVKS